jgi:hypothetical protein
MPMLGVTFIRSACDELSALGATRVLLLPDETRYLAAAMRDLLEQISALVDRLLI